MKNLFKHTTGIVIMIAILIAGCCRKEDKGAIIKGTKTTIYFKAFKKGEKMHIMMWNSYDPYSVSIDSLFYTDVEPGMTVIWEPVEGSGILKIKRIGPKEEGEIMPGDAEEILKSKKFKHEIPKDAKAGKEEYDIEFLDNDGNSWSIDPFLRVPTDGNREQDEADETEE